MARKKIAVFAAAASAWTSFLEKYFSDVPARVLFSRDRNSAFTLFSKELPSMVFTAPGYLSLPLLQKIRVQTQTDRNFRCYFLAEGPAAKPDPVFRAGFSLPDSAGFEKKWIETLPLPDIIKLLVVDDEGEIAATVRDYLDGKTRPAFEVMSAANGSEALDRMARTRPDAVLLDIKMPVMDGRECYAEIRRRWPDLPVIVFFDSVSGEELADIRRHGNPPVVEKGGHSGSMPALTALIKKTVYFGV